MAGASRRASLAQRWFARLTLATVAAAALVLLIAAGARSLVLLAVGAAGLLLTAAGLWWTISQRGVLRLLAVALMILAPIAVLVFYILTSLTWAVLLSLGLMVLAVAWGRAALSREPGPTPMPEYPVPPPKRAFLIMNPRSGGGKVANSTWRPRPRRWARWCRAPPTVLTRPARRWTCFPSSLPVTAERACGRAWAT